MSAQRAAATTAHSEVAADDHSSTSTATSTTTSPPPYTLSTLEPAHVDEWLDHLAASFSHKGTPRSYFHRHLLHDPHLDHAAIILLHTPHHRCVSSIRVFLRTVYVRGELVLCGGIGEVSTQVEWRGKGFAAVCLQRGVEYMQGLGAPLSSLHTSNAASYYQQLGWQPVERVHGLLSVNQIPAAANVPGTSDSPYVIQQLSASELISSPLLASVMSTYDSYARQFNGPVARTAEYWQRWVHAEHEAAAATSSPVVQLLATSTAASTSDICGYVFLQRVDKPITVQRAASTAAPSTADSSDTLSLSSRLLVREFACSASEMRRDGGRALLLALLHHSSQSLDTFTSSHSSDTLYVQYALPIALGFQPPLESEYEHLDTGFMYRPIEAVPASHPDTATESQSQPSRYKREDFAHLSQTDGRQLLSALQADGQNKHVFFATDAF